MYNLKIDMGTSTPSMSLNNFLAVENSCTTPRTPEILNSVIAMTNPLEYSFGTGNGEDRPKRYHANSISSDSNSSSCSQESRTNGNGSSTNGPTSVQRTCSQLIKAGLKLTIEQKRKLHSDGEDLLDLDKVKRIKRNESESEEDKYQQINGLTPEDEERRRRRRERNKIAATKCRLKKRERTANLMTESDHLEAQNIQLKSQLQELQNESRRLANSLDLHKSSCQKNITCGTTNGTREQPNPYNRLPPVTSVMEPNNHSYSRPGSVDTNFQRTTENFNQQRPSSANGSFGYTRTSLQYITRTPSIIIENLEEDYQTNITNLDDPTETYTYNYPTNQQNYGKHGIDGCMA